MSEPTALENFEYQTPGVWRRMACWLYEGMLLFGVVFIAGYLFGTLTQTRNAMDNRTALQVFIFLALSAYFVIFWTRGQTLAMKTWHIRLVDTHGALVTRQRALLRYALSWVWVLPPLALAWEAALPAGADGQVQRVADRFALVAAAGDLASAWGVTGWPVGASREAALRCFADWLKERGGAGSGEVAQARRALLEWIETYGKARLEDWLPNSNRAVINPRSGFVKTKADGDELLESNEIFLFGPVLRTIWQGLDFKAMETAFAGKGIVVQPDGNLIKQFKVPADRKPHRLYQIDFEALQGTDGQADD